MNDLQKYKFRAKLSEVDGGGYAYGDLRHAYGRCYLDDPIKGQAFVIEEKNAVLLVGYIPDKSGLGVIEVYEGDKLRTKSGEIIYATIQRFCQAGRHEHSLDLTELAGDLELV